MTALTVILSVILAVLLLLMCKIKVRVVSDGDIKVKLGVGPVMVGVFPARKKKLRLRDFSHKRYLKKQSADASGKIKKQVNTESGKSKKGTFDETKDFLLELVGRVGKYTGKLHSKVSALSVKVGGSDAATTAITYGAVSQGVAYLLEILDCKTRLKVPHPERLEVLCDYTAEKVTFNADVTFCIRIIDALKCALELLSVKLKHDGKAQVKTEKISSKKKGSNRNGRK